MGLSEPRRVWRDGGSERLTVVDDSECQTVNDGSEFQTVNDGSERQTIDVALNAKLWMRLWKPNCGEMVALKAKLWRDGGFECLTVDNGSECQTINDGSECQIVNDNSKPQTVDMALNAKLWMRL